LFDYPFDHPIPHGIPALDNKKEFPGIPELEDVIELILV
jgi:hypothetical protein